MARTFKVIDTAKAVEQKALVIKEAQYNNKLFPQTNLNGITFIVPLMGKTHNIAGFIQNISRYDCDIIFVVQADNKPFNKGALYNLGFKHSTTDVVIFADIDIRHEVAYDFIELMIAHQRPFVPFDTIRQIKDNNQIGSAFRPSAWGGCVVFTRNQFEFYGGFSNRILHWGFDDAILNKRAKMLRLQGSITHIHHKRLDKDSKNKGFYDKNKEVFNNDYPKTDNNRTVKGDLQFKYTEGNVSWFEYSGLGNDTILVPIETDKQTTKKKLMKDIVFNQFFGIGDIIFIEPIIRSFFQKGHKVILPVLSKFADIQPYFPYITVVDKDTLDIDYECQKVVETDDMIIYPVRWSKEYFRSRTYNDTMKNKYRMFDLDLDEWRKVTWLKHRWKIDSLKELLGIKKGEKYNLINNNFYSFDTKVRKFEVDNNHKNIEMSIIDGYTLFDWEGVIRDATTIHTVNTSILYLMETLELKAKEIHFYSRNSNGSDFGNVDYLMSKNYKLHD